MPPSTVGGFLRDARERGDLSLRAVEETTGISNAYLSQLENGRIRQPSPVVLYKLCKAYGASYERAMHLAGYPVPKAGLSSSSETSGRLSRFGDISAEEETALAEYLEFLRARRRGIKS